MSEKTRLNPTQEKIRIGLVGGGIGRQHLEGFVTLPDQFEIAGFCDLNTDILTQFQTEYNIPYITNKFDDLIERDDIDVIDICTPPFLHFNQVKAALEAGKNVICEKPLVATLAEVDALEEICKATGQHILPVYQYRYGHGLQKLIHLRDAGVLGRPFTADVDVQWRRDAAYFAVPWRGVKKTHLGGCLMDQSIHMHDIIEFVLGRATSVTARTRTLVNPIETEDCAAVIMEMDQGALVTENITLGAASEKTRMTFIFENMTITSDHINPYAPQREPWVFVPKSDEIERNMVKALETYSPDHESYAGLFNAYFKALKNGTELPITLEDAHRSIGLVSAMYASADTKESQTLPLSKEHSYYNRRLDDSLAA